MDDYARRKEHTKNIDGTGADGSFDIQNTDIQDTHNSIDPLYLYHNLIENRFQCHFFGGEYRLGILYTEYSSL